jgi:hypothetical protein
LAYAHQPARVLLVVVAAAVLRPQHLALRQAVHLAAALLLLLPP